MVVSLIAHFNLYAFDRFHNKIPFYLYFTATYFIHFCFLFRWLVQALLCFHEFLTGAIFLPFLMAFAEVSLNFCAESVSGMGVANNTAIGAGRILQLLSPYSFDEYIRC